MRLGQAVCDRLTMWWVWRLRLQNAAGPHSPKAVKPAVQKLDKACQCYFLQPQQTNPAARTTLNSTPSTIRPTRSWPGAWRSVWLWVLAPAVIVFSAFLAVQLLPASFYTQPASITCLMRGQEQVCAAVLEAAAAAADQDPPGWLLPVLQAKWLLQDAAARILGLEALCAAAVTGQQQRGTQDRLLTHSTVLSAQRLTQGQQAPCPSRLPRRRTAQRPASSPNSFPTTTCSNFLPQLLPRSLQMAQAA